METQFKVTDIDFFFLNCEGSFMQIFHRTQFMLVFVVYPDTKNSFAFTGH